MIGAVVAASWAMLRRDRAALALSFAVPIVFFSIFAVVFGGRSGGGMRRVELLVADEDGSRRSRRLVAALESEEALAVRRAPEAVEGEPAPAAYDRAAAERAVREGEAAVALVVPRGFGAARIAFGPGSERPRLELLVDSSDPVAGRMAAGLLQKAVFTGLGDAMLESGIDSLDRTALFTPEQRERLSALTRSVEAEGGSAGGFDLPVEIATRDLMGESKRTPMVSFYAAALGVMFLLFSASGAGGALIEERESGTLDRLLSTRVTMTQLLAGKLAYLTSLGIAQLALMFGWGWLVFDLELAGRLGGVAAMAVPTALVCSAFGLVLAAVCRTRKQLVATSNLVILSISALGGSMFPRFLMPEAIQKASLVAFNSWALEGFLDVLWRERGLAEILPEIAVLLAWTALFFAVARRIARRWEVV